MQAGQRGAHVEAGTVPACHSGDRECGGVRLPLRGVVAACDRAVMRMLSPSAGRVRSPEDDSGVSVECLSAHDGVHVVRSVPPCCQSFPDLVTVCCDTLH
jgi:hypothetical protein